MSSIRESCGGDSYDNALAESVIGLYKTEVIRKDGPWKGVDDVEFATLDWVSWFNEQRLLGSIGDIPPAEFGQMYYQQQQSRLTRRDATKTVSGKPGVVHRSLAAS